MTPKDYNIIAAALKSAKPNPSAKHFNDMAVSFHKLVLSTWRDTVNAVAVACKRDNARFDIERFLEACDDDEEENPNDAESARRDRGKPARDGTTRQAGDLRFRRTRS